MTSYIKDILSQPAVLRIALEQYSLSALKKVDLAEFDRILISGMDPSCYAAYPALRPLPWRSEKVSGPASSVMSARSQTGNNVAFSYPNF